MTARPDLSWTLQQPHWDEVAYHWHHFGPPLRPSVADVRMMEEILRRWWAGHDATPLKVLLWGVTPEIAAMAWPDNTALLAVDRSAQMIERVWPGDIVGRRKAICADWFECSSGSDRYDVIIGDGNFTVLAYPDQYQMLAASARDMLATDGILITRYFIQPTEVETPEAVFDDLQANRIASFHGFKFRLAMALQERAESGIRMGDIFSAWKSAHIRLEALMAMTGWTQGAIETIHLYDGKDSRLTFPTVAEIDAVMGKYFEKLDERYLPYEIGERCPIVSYRPQR
jgi:hypothetical protein